MSITPQDIEVVRAYNGLWRFVNKTESCWLWTGALASTGYGQIRLGGSVVLAHRVTFMMENGFIPGSTCVLHRCDVRACVRPDHLFAGTKADNTADMIAKGRVARGEDLPQCKLTKDRVGEIKRMLAAGSRAVDVAKMLGVSQQAVCNIKQGRIWAWVSAEERQ